MECATRLLAEARRSNERRMLVLTGAAGSTRERANDIVQSTEIDPDQTVYVGPATSLDCNGLSATEADTLLGTSHEAIIYDCHDRFEPNTLGKLVGAVEGGGLFVLLTPPLSKWPARRDEFDSTLAVVPYSISDVGTAFRTRLVETLRNHRGIAIVDAETGTVHRDGLTHPAPRLPEPSPTVPPDGAFPLVAYEACLTGDQLVAVQSIEKLLTPGEAVVIEADRGRGKSSAAGIGAACLAARGRDVLVTSPTPSNVGPLFARAREVLRSLSERGESTDIADEGSGESTATIRTATGQIRYERPADAATASAEADCVVVDEAAAIPVRLLEAFLDADAVAFLTTVRGYEGTGRGFAIRFRDRLAESRYTVSERQLSTPIRYAPADPIEVWAFRALALDASPPPDASVVDATTETVSYRQLSTDELRGDEQLLREVVGLLVFAHYRTEPNDLARLLDAPNVSVHGLTHDGHVVAVALLSREGDLSATRRARMFEGDRIRGNLIPDVLTSQLRDESAGSGVGFRVMRIATHAAARSRGLGSLLLDYLSDHALDADVDWLGVAFGVTPELADFWVANGYRTVHLSTTRNDRSGEHSLVMLRPLSAWGEDLHERHTRWFLRRTPASLSESLSAARPAVIRAACRSVDDSPSLSLSTFEWRHAAGLPNGTALYETAPRGIRRLVFRHLVAPDDPELLTTRDERILIRKTLQGQSWETVAAGEGFHSTAECKRTLGAAIEPLVACYGDETAVEELQRYE